MHTLTRIVLSHRRAVVLIWLLLAVAGAATAKTTIGGLTTSYVLAGSPGYTTNQQIAAGMTTGAPRHPRCRSSRCQRARRSTAVVWPPRPAAYSRPGTPVPHVRIADYATTGDRAFVTAGGRSTYALIFTPGNQPDTLQPADIAVARAVQAAGAAAPDRAADVEHGSWNGAQRHVGRILVAVVADPSQRHDLVTGRA